MKRPLRAEEARLWAVVAATVRPSKRSGGHTPSPEVERGLPPATPHDEAPSSRREEGGTREVAALAPSRPASRLFPHVSQGIEPNRRRRIARGRDAIAGRLDLHGYDQDRARARLLDFLLAAQADGARAVLVITGKGFMGEGVLRRRAPEWLADPALRNVVAGLSPADPQHGGAGAWYVALKRKPR